jgi:hypothetical protein
MTSLQIFAFFVLPVVVVALAAVVYWLEGRRLRRHGDPDLFDKRSLHTPGE